MQNAVNEEALLRVRWSVGGRFSSRRRSTYLQYPSAPRFLVCTWALGLGNFEMYAARSTLLALLPYYKLNNLKL